jgi:hypothetical protein
VGGDGKWGIAVIFLTGKWGIFWFFEGGIFVHRLLVNHRLSDG